jgi:hypothetical protein
VANVADWQNIDWELPDSRVKNGGMEVDPENWQCALSIFEQSQPVGLKTEDSRAG